jgi:hypothetical protein
MLFSLRAQLRKKSISDLLSRAILERSSSAGQAPRLDAVIFLGTIIAKLEFRPESNELYEKQRFIFLMHEAFKFTKN